MPEENRVELAELIEQVKQELLSTYPSDKSNTPFLSVDSIELELQVTVKKEAKGGVKINVLQFGGGELSGGGSRDDVQKVKVTLSPLLKKEQLLSIYQKHNPEQWKQFLETSVEALTKGSEKNIVDEY
ncbi:hypothetical protein DSM106972_072120 [Dulcicalothrix desertica PCC 7102]|uniref:Trypsin-co-occurring domain-containing protein n=1 Tax=Dulcicalothrix desertica PCC 7102 TaxID=232991 RepID=A0A3S1CZF6_9CYAN|nr:trypco2 family protein [Dulcicalothrix desertica]RUT00803.1 hypothetical protein DSM106972_072120 [Dulcicalothrix desertica PCC 7102]TWH42354.1 hypothetical protein CAL7102_06003 [Dulcicalothrix desertica PCC 7102]